MDTVSLLMAQYGGKAVVPLDNVCRDYFAPMTVPTLVRKIFSGEIDLVLIRIEHSRKSAKGVRIQDLAHYIDTRRTIGAERVKAISAVPRPDGAAPAVERSSERQQVVPRAVIPPDAPPEREGAIAPAMERALTLKMAADLLGVSYGTVYAHRERLGFFQIGSVWRVWPEMLRDKLLAKTKEKPQLPTDPSPQRNGLAEQSQIPFLSNIKAAEELDKLPGPVRRSHRRAAGVTSAVAADEAIATARLGRRRKAD